MTNDDPTTKNASKPAGEDDLPAADGDFAESGKPDDGGGRQPRDRQIDIEIPSNAGRRKLITDLTWPALAENLLSSLVSIVDMLMVSSLGAYAINAVGLVTQPRFVLLASFMALSVGSTAMVARFKGAREQENACVVLNQSLIMTFFLTVVICVLMYNFGDALVRLLAGTNISEQTIREGSAYLRIQVIGFPTLSFTFCINAILRGVGNTRASFYTNASANLVNVFFNYCMIGGNLGFPAWGVAGASIATVIGQFSGLCIAIYTVARGKEYVSFRLRLLTRIDLQMIKRILRIGIPAFAEQVIMRVGMMLFTVIVTSLGDNAYASHMVAMNIQNLSFTTGMAFGTAATTLMGQCLGRIRADLAKIYVKMTQNLGLIVSCIVAVSMFVGAEWITSMYSNDAEIIRQAALMLRVIAIVNPVSNARFVYVSALRGAGDSRYAAFITFIGVILIRPLISYALISTFLPFQIGLLGIWIGLSSDSVICFLLSWRRYARGKWIGIRV